MSFLTETAQDVQSSVLCLAGAVGGAASEKAADYLVNLAGVKDNGVGGVGLQFVIRAACAGVGYSLVASQLPGTSGMALFSILFFAASPRFINAGVNIAQRVVGGVEMAANVRGAVSSCACKH